MRKDLRTILILAAVLTVIGAAHLVSFRGGEPFYNNDETRHIMTGVFFHDLLRRMPLDNLANFALEYYMQYPALGLTVWPPAFHLTLGAWMVGAGTSFTASLILVLIFFAVAAVYLYYLVLRTHDLPTAALAVLLFGFSPVVFFFSQCVMLEIPTLAFVLAALFHFHEYLVTDRPLHIRLAALASALAALTRFSGVLLLPTFVILIVLRRNLALVTKREVISAAAFGLILVLPFYVVASYSVGTFQFSLFTQSILPHAFEGMSLERFLSYPSMLPSQLGWFALVPAAVGFAISFSPAGRKRISPYLALILATYLTFTFMSIHESRFVIYWIPAFTALAADALTFPLRAFRSWLACVAVALIAIIGTISTALSLPPPELHGYRETAELLVRNSPRSSSILFDGALNGNFIYQVRRTDRSGTIRIIRGDKLFYASPMGDPTLRLTEYARTDADFLRLIYEYDPEYLILEEPRLFSEHPVASRLRSVIANHPELFELVHSLPIRSNEANLSRSTLRIYRPLHRNPHPRRLERIPIPLLNRDIQSSIRAPDG